MSPLAFLFGEFEEDARRRFRVNKADSPAVGPEPRLLVHKAVPELVALQDRLVEIWDADADVVNPRPALCNESGNGAFRIGRLEQLDLNVAEVQRNDGRAVHRFERSGGDAQDVAVKPHGLIDTGYGEPDVCDSGVRLRQVVPLWEQ